MRRNPRNSDHEDQGTVPADLNKAVLIYESTNKKYLDLNSAPAIYLTCDNRKINFFEPQVYHKEL